MFGIRLFFQSGGVYGGIAIAFALSTCNRAVFVV